MTTMTQTKKHSQVYLRFLHLAQAVRSLPTFPALDALEERFLNVLAASWHAGDRVTVLEAMRLLPDVSSTTAHRRLKTLRAKGLIVLQADESDSRIKYVTPTDSANKYFARLGQLLDKARAG